MVQWLTALLRVDGKYFLLTDGIDGLHGRAVVEEAPTP